MLLNLFCKIQNEIQTQEEEAKKLAKDKAKELAKLKLETQKKGGGGRGVSTTSYSSQSIKNEPQIAGSDDIDHGVKPSYTPK